MLFHAPAFILVLLSVVHASGWFTAEPEYSKWSPTELRSWLEDHNIKVPPHFGNPHLYDLVQANWHTSSSPLNAHAEAGGRQWTLDQYNKAQRAFQYIKDDTFDKWDESTLRAFLLEQGVVAPSGPREQLVLLAKEKYRSYSDAATFYSSLASASASSVYAQATDTAHSASQRISSAVSQATQEATRAFDDTKDYIYSAWDDTRLRNWLEEHGVLEAKTAKNREELTGLIKHYYRKADSAVWESWSDSYIREWLIAHNLLKPSDTPSRSSLLRGMNKYYYDYSEKVWNTWSESELRAWLVEHGLLKSDSQKKRDELVRMVEVNYLSAADSAWRAWSDSAIRQWLSEHGYLEESSTLRSRNELMDLMNRKYADTSEKAAPYLVWPDARLRAYLREKGVSESALPSDRSGLLQETRIRWLQGSAKLETLFAKLKEIVNSSVEAAEEKLARVFNVLSGHSHDSAQASEKRDNAHEYAEGKKAHGWSWGPNKVDQARGKASEAREFAVKHASESLRWDKEKVKAANDEL